MGDTMLLLHWKILWGYIYAPSIFARECKLELVYLTKKIV